LSHITKPLKNTELGYATKLLKITELHYIPKLPQNTELHYINKLFKFNLELSEIIPSYSEIIGNGPIILNNTEITDFNEFNELLFLKKLVPSSPILNPIKFTSSLLKIVFRTHPRPIFYRWSLFPVVLNRCFCAQYKNTVPVIPFEFPKTDVLCPSPYYHSRELLKNPSKPPVDPLEYPNVSHHKESYKFKPIQPHIQAPNCDKFSILVNSIDRGTISFLITKNIVFIRLKEFSFRKSIYPN
jgi:hypothetical protein